MMISSDTARALAGAADIVNTAPTVNGSDLLKTPTDIQCIMDRYHMRRDKRPTDRDVQLLRQLRHITHGIFETEQESRVADHVNRLLAHGHFAPTIVNHDAAGWHIHYFHDSARIADRIACEQGIAFAWLLVVGEWQRLGTCRAPNCGRVFVDMSRNRSRRYCQSAVCGTRVRVSAHRERRRQLTAV